MTRSFFVRSTLAATFLISASERLSAQHSHSHSDTAATASHSHTPADPMSGMGADWKMAAMARHMAYTSSRPLTPADFASI